MLTVSNGFAPTAFGNGPFPRRGELRQRSWRQAPLDLLKRPMGVKIFPEGQRLHSPKLT